MADSLGLGWFRLHGPIPEGEVWEFQPGDIVWCEERKVTPEGGFEFVAVNKLFDQVF